MTDFRALIESLLVTDVQFVVVGGVAATLHGSARLTQDVDIVYARDEENLPFEPYLRGAPEGLPFRFDVQTLSAGLNFTLRTKMGNIDLLGRIDGVGDHEALAGHTIEVELFGHRCRCLDSPTLIEAKLAAGSDRDLDAVAELRALQQEIEKRRGG